MKSLAILLLLTVSIGSSDAGAGQANNTQSGAVSSVEEIYIGRNIRESRRSPTEFCSQGRTGFAATTEDEYAVRSIATREDNGRVIDANIGAIGRFHACAGPTADAKTLRFYAEGSIGGISLTAVGDCRALKPDHPEPGITAYVCALDLRDLPSDYVGGQATTNTVTSRSAIGEKSEPPGYTQPSIVTFRLWRRK